MDCWLHLSPNFSQMSSMFLQGTFVCLTFLIIFSFRSDFIASQFLAVVKKAIDRNLVLDLSKLFRHNLTSVNGNPVLAELYMKFCPSCDLLQLPNSLALHCAEVLLRQNCDVDGLFEILLEARKRRDFEMLRRVSYCVIYLRYSHLF
jgi:hypothetical protein